MLDITHVLQSHSDPLAEWLQAARSGTEERGITTSPLNRGKSILFPERDVLAVKSALPQPLAHPFRFDTLALNHELELFRITPLSRSDLPVLNAKVPFLAFPIQLRMVCSAMPTSLLTS